MNFEKAKILIFYPYGCTKHYGDSIRDELIKRGAIVYSFDERPSQSTLSKVFIRLLKKKIPEFFISYLKKVVESLKGIEPDYVVVIRGEAFTFTAVEFLRQCYPNSKFILYLWDILRVNNQIDASKQYDKVLSFDEEDARRNLNMIYRPTFFPPEYIDIAVNDKKDRVSDILFIGTLNPYRYRIFKAIEKKLEKGSIFEKYLYIPSRLLLLKDKLFDRKYASGYKYSFHPLTLPESIKRVAKTRAIIDVTYLSEGQCGMSMRAYEAMASKRKYITTNHNISNYDFYNKDNILILNPQDPIIPSEFLKSDFKSISKEILDRYSVSAWVDDVFDGF